MYVHFFILVSRCDSLLRFHFMDFGNANCRERVVTELLLQSQVLSNTERIYTWQLLRHSELDFLSPGKFVPQFKFSAAGGGVLLALSFMSKLRLW